MITAVAHWIKKNHRWLFSGVGVKIVYAVIALIIAVPVFVVRCIVERPRSPQIRPSPSPTLTLTPQKELKDLEKENAAAIERGLLSLDSHGVLRLIDLRKGIQSNDAKTYNYLAWHWATCPNNEHIDSTRALEFAQRAVTLRPDDDNFTDTLAAAYARNGKFADAIATEQKAIDMIDDQIERAGITAPTELLADDSALAWMDDTERQRYRKVEDAWKKYQEQVEPYSRRRKELEGRLELYRKGRALISTDYPTPTSESQ